MSNDTNTTTDDSKQVVFEDTFGTDDSTPKPSPYTDSLPLETDIIADKQLRVDIDAVLQRVKDLPPSRERSLARTKLEEAVMWLGMDLKRLGTPNPYPNSRDVGNAIVDPTADGLKL